MSRTTLLTAQELTWSTLKLSQAHSLAELSFTIREVFMRVFNPQHVYFYYMHDGRLHIPRDANISLDQHREELYRVIGGIKYYDALDSKRLGRLVHYNSEVFKWYADQPQMIQRAYNEGFYHWGLDWMVGSHFLDGDVFLACAGIGRAFEHGAWSQYDVAAMESLYPHLDAALKVCCAADHVRRFGSAVAQAIEHHPCPILIFQNQQLTFANRESREFFRHDSLEYENDWPLWQRSATATAIAKRLSGESAVLPASLDGAHFIDLSLGFYQGDEPVNLIVLRPQAIPESIRLTEREHELLRLLFTGMGIKEAAQRAMIKESTFRTHLKNAYKRLGVSSLNEALVLVSLQSIDNENNPELL